MSTNTSTKRNAVVLGALALLVGCAGTQTRGKTTPEPLPDETGPSAAASKAPANDEIAAVTNKVPAAAEPKVSDDQRADFDKAVAVYQKVKRGGMKGSDCDEAASAFRRVADANPQMLVARSNEAAVYMECGRTQDAMRIWDDLGRKGYAPALASLGYAAWQRGDHSGAESYFTRAISADPQLGSISARINLAQILRERARRISGPERDQIIGDALRHLRSVLALDGNSLQAYATICYLYWDLGRPDGAILVGNQAIARAEEIATGKFQEEAAPGDLEGGRGRNKKSKADKGDDSKKGKEAASGQGTGWTPDMKKHIALVYNTLGLVELDKKAYSFAISNFKKGVELDPELMESRLNLAALSLKFRDYPTAEDNFAAVVKAQPKNYDAIIGLGVAQRGNRKFDEAEQQYLAAQKLDASRPESYFNLGLLYQEYKGSEKPTLQKAQQYYREFLQHPNGAPKMRKDAEKRIKDIDELFVALEEAAKMQKEAEELQRKAEEQQKKMEEEMKKMQEQEKAQQGAAAAAGANATQPPATAVENADAPKAKKKKGK